MASHTVEREIFVFSENAKEIVNATRPFSFANDGRLLLCCREVLLIFTVSCDLDVRSHSFRQNLPCKIHVQKIVDLSTIPQFSITDGISDLLNMLKNVSDSSNRQELLLDSSLHGIDFFSKADLGGFRSAVFSPQLKSSTRGLFIAAATHNHRVLVFEEHSEDWRLYCEMTSKLKRHMTASVDLPVTLRADGMSYDQYKDFVGGMSCVEIAWSSLFVRETGSELDISVLLFCGMRNGDVHIWQMQNLHGSTETNENAFSFIGLDKHASEVTSLFWHCAGSNWGYFAVGYMDGGVRILRIQLSTNGSQHFDVKCLFEYKSGDHLAVSDLSLTEITHDTFIALACKQFCISMFCIKDVCVEYLKTIHVDCSLPLESLSMRGNLASASSQDGNIHHFLISSHGDDISLNCVKSKVTCLPSMSKATWCCKGLVLSPHGALCFSLHKPYSDFLLKNQSRHRERQRLILSLAPYFQHEHCLPVRFDQIYSSLESYVDVTLRLLFLMQNASKDSTTMETVEKMLSQFVVSDRMEFLHIARAVYLFEFLKIWEGSSHDQSLKLSKENKLRELALSSLIKHIFHCCQSAQECHVDLPTQLPFMCTWVIGKKERLEALTKYMDVDKHSIFTHKNHPLAYVCILCDSEVKSFDHLLEAKCANGHIVQLCCVTFSPVEGSKIRHCLSCNAAALDINKIKMIAVPYIQRVHWCTLCGGSLQ